MVTEKTIKKDNLPGWVLHPEVFDNISNCCGVKLEDDSDICPKCKEHCEREVYEK
jgi:hypothetical protein